MTTFSERRATCGVCNELSDQMILTSTSSFGAPDLDLRPAPMKRGTMEFWVQCCPHCDYVSSDLEEVENLDAVRRVMIGPDWRALAQNLELPELTWVFLRRSLITQALGDLQEAGLAALYAAWGADDEDDAAWSEKCRRRATDLTIALLKTNPLDQQTDHITRLRLIDMLRRVGSWEEAASQSAELTGKSDDPTITAVLRYQTELIARRDADRHTVADATEAATGSVRGH